MKTQTKKTLAALLIPMLGIVTSCATSSVVDYSLPGFFVCNRVVDKPPKGVLNKKDIEGKKYVFSADEPITIVSYFENKKGMDMKIIIMDPKGRVMFEHKDKIIRDYDIGVVEFKPGQLRQTGYGRYNANLYINDNLVNITGFNLIK